MAEMMTIIIRDRSLMDLLRTNFKVLFIVLGGLVHVPVLKGLLLVLK